MDLARIEADLLEWDLLQPGPPLAWSRRLRGAVMRAAVVLQELEAAGRAPKGHPVRVALEVAAGQAFPELPLTATHRDFLAAVELTALPDAVRTLLDRPA